MNPELPSTKLHLTALWREQALSLSVPKPVTVSEQSLVQNYVYAHMKDGGVAPQSSSIYTDETRITYIFGFSAENMTAARKCAMKITKLLRHARGRSVTVETLRKGPSRAARTRKPSGGQPR